MNILLVDNGTIRLAELQKLLQGNNVTTIKFGEVDSSGNENFNNLLAVNSVYEG